MTLSTFLQQLKNNENISFEQTISIITENYLYTPTEFSNGLANDKLVNPAGSNEGSCKIFAFAQINQLSPQQTLNLFGDFYRKDVLNNQAGNNHQNIRNFMQYGWEGIHFSNPALVAK